MTARFHTMIQHEDPSLIGIGVGPWYHSFTRALRTTKGCLLVIPTVDLATKVVDIANCGRLLYLAWKRGMSLFLGQRCVTFRAHRSNCWEDIDL
jgi:hypothetical protein